MPSPLVTTPPQNDPLRARASGFKRDYFEKGQIRYPQDKEGVVDEWRALVKTVEEKHKYDIEAEKGKKKDA